MSQNVFYIAAKSAEEDGGIYRYSYGEKTGVHLRGFSAHPGTNFLCRSFDGKRLYASGGEPAPQGFIAAYQIGPDGALRKEAEFYTEKSNCHLLQAGEFLYASNYRDGSFSEFRLKNGIVEEERKRIAHHGSGPVPGRQTSAHVHSCNLTPDGKYLAVIDLGSDTISCYTLHKNGISDTPAQVYHTPAGDGPRHMIFSADGKTAYVLNELSSSVSSLKYENGKFIFLHRVSTLPRFFKGAAKGAAIRFDPAQCFFCATNRGFDSVACFSATPRGALKRVSLTLTAGKSPRDGNFISPQCYAAACEESDEVIFFDYRNGSLTPNGLHLKLPHPLYVLPLVPMICRGV